MALFVTVSLAADDIYAKLWRLVARMTAGNGLLTIFITIPLASIAIGIVVILWHCRRTIIKTIAWILVIIAIGSVTIGLFSLTIDLFSLNSDAFDAFATYGFATFAIFTVCIFTGCLLNSLVDMQDGS